MSYLRKHWQQVLATSVLLVAFAMPLLLGRNLLKVVSTIAHDIVHIQQTTLAARQAESAADFGFAYIMRMWQNYPLSDHFPTIRYADSSHNVQLLLPKINSHTDDFVILAINVPESAFVPMPIADLHSASTATTSLQTIWTFKTGDDYDTLSAFTLIPQSCGAEQQQLKVEVYIWESDTQPATVSTKSVSCAAGKIIAFPLETPLQKLSFSRGGMPFKVVVTSSAPIVWHQLTAEGIKINVEGFTLLNRTDDNYTYIRNDILQTASDAWQEYLNYIRNV